MERKIVRKTLEEKIWKTQCFRSSCVFGEAGTSSHDDAEKKTHSRCNVVCLLPTYYNVGIFSANVRQTLSIKQKIITTEGKIPLEYWFTGYPLKNMLFGATLDTPAFTR